MMNNVSDGMITRVIERIATGEINPDIKRYVLLTDSGRQIAYDAINEAAARDMAEDRGHQIMDLVDVEPITYNGLTLGEIRMEAKKRDLGEF